MNEIRARIIQAFDREWRKCEVLSRRSDCALAAAAEAVRVVRERIALQPRDMTCIAEKSKYNYGWNGAASEALDQIDVLLSEIESGTQQASKESCASRRSVTITGRSETETASGYLRAEAYFKSIQYLSARVAELEAKVDRWTASLDEAEGAYTTAFGAVKFLRARMEESFPPSRDHADTEPTR